MSQRVLIVGAGGHGQVVADILLRMQEGGHPIEPVGFLDDDPQLWGKRFLGIPVLGGMADLPAIPHDAIIIGIGDNETRRRVFLQWKAVGERFIVARHPDAVVAPDVIIGAGAMICAGVVVNTGAWIGENVILNTGCTVDHHNRIRDHVHIAPGVHLAGNVEVGEGTLVGIGAVMIPQRKVGAWSVIGAGAVVTEDIPARTVAVGVPARPLRE